MVALAVAAVVVVLFLTGGEDSYEVTAEFENASQLVPGNEVIVGGVAAGSVKEIELGDDGQALVSFTVNEDYAPLRRGTTATVRSYSLSGIANRQIQLTLPPNSQDGQEIPEGGSLSQEETVSEVDLDEVFNTLDPATVKDFKHVVQGFERSYDGVSEQANEGFRYLNPFLSTSRGLFSELTFDERALERLIVDSAKLSGALSERAPDLSALIGNLNQMMGAIGAQKLALAESIGKFPGFMRSANTTFANLRAALDDLAPLIDASKPAAKELQPFMAKLRLAVADAVPTIRDLDAIVRRGGPSNDLVELTRLQVPLAKAGVGQGSPECGSDPEDPTELAAAQDDDYTQGSFGESVCALSNGNAVLSDFRPYTPELVGWFDGFSHPGTIDAQGGIGRISTSFNEFSASPLSPAGTFVPDLLSPIDPLDALSGAVPGLNTTLDRRCPGTNERPLDGADPSDDSVPFTDNGAIDCDPADVPEGP